MKYLLILFLFSCLSCKDGGSGPLQVNYRYDSNLSRHQQDTLSRDIKEKYKRTVYHPARDSAMMVEIKESTLTGVIIVCCGRKFTCTNYGFVEDFPDTADEYFYDEGWRVIRGLVYCPDCSNDVTRQNK